MDGRTRGFGWRHAPAAVGATADASAWNRAAPSVACAGDGPAQDGSNGRSVGQSDTLTNLCIRSEGQAPIRSCCEGVPRCHDERRAIPSSAFLPIASESAAEIPLNTRIGPMIFTARCNVGRPLRFERGATDAGLPPGQQLPSGHRIEESTAHRIDDDARQSRAPQNASRIL
jgi:hypothetical protein